MFTGLLALVACTSTPAEVTRSDVAALEAAILALSPDVDPDEAARAAQLAYTRTAELKEAYEITDPPLVHNAKVNMGLRPRGLCWHWADDMEQVLAAQGFQTLSLHRAIANATTLRIDHSTVIVSAKGEGMFDGIVLDPWRKGGELTWVGTDVDPKYKWVPRHIVFADRARRERLKNF